MINNKYGNWTIIGIAEPDFKKRKRYLCKCICGFEKIHYLHYLVSGKSTKCKNCRLKELGKLEIGQKFNKWTIIGFVVTETSCLYKVKCECGNISQARSTDLKNNKTTRCIDCYNKVRINPSKTHGLSNKKIYRIWRAMKERCLIKSNKDYDYYGGRGITICDSWLRFENFYNDMGDQPKGMQIDRIDNNQGYFKENCRWVTPKENCNNRRKKGEGRIKITT